MILRTRLRLEQRREPGVAVAGVVVDDGQVARALRDQRVDQLGRHAGRAEAADHHGRAVLDAGHRLAHRRYLLVDQDILRRNAFMPPSWRARPGTAG